MRSRWSRWSGRRTSRWSGRRTSARSRWSRWSGRRTSVRSRWSGRRTSVRSRWSGRRTSVRWSRWSGRSTGGRTPGRLSGIGAAGGCRCVIDCILQKTVDGLCVSRFATYQIVQILCRHCYVCNRQKKECRVKLEKVNLPPSKLPPRNAIFSQLRDLRAAAPLYTVLA